MWWSFEISHQTINRLTLDDVIRISLYIKFLLLKNINETTYIL